MTLALEIATPEWALPLLEPARYKGAKGGRGSGKSHFFAEAVVEAMVCDPDLRVVCIREIQRSLKFSAKSLIERKIQDLGVSHLFEVLNAEIRRVGGSGVCIFEGLQNHTADSIKSLDGFRVAWVEEAQRLSQRSLDLLLPTIREPGSEIWFSWNPDQPDDPVERLLVSETHDSAAVVHVNYTDNPFCPPEIRNEAERRQKIDPDGYAHIWLGQYNTRNEAQVLAGRWRVDEFEPQPHWDGPYHGADWGFANDPTVLVRCWIGDGRLWVDYDVGGVGVGLDQTPKLFDKVPTVRSHKIRADAARPETIEYLKRKHGFDIVAAPKWAGSVEDGVEYLRKFDEVVIHQRCSRAQEEARLWSYQVDRLTGDVKPKLADGNDHTFDAIRYALAPLIRPGKQVRFA